MTFYKMTVTVFVLLAGTLGLQAGTRGYEKTARIDVQTFDSFATNMAAATLSSKPFSVKKNLARHSASLYYYTGRIMKVPCPSGKAVGNSTAQVWVKTTHVSFHDWNTTIGYTDSNGYYSIELDRDEVPYPGAVFFINEVDVHDVSNPHVGGYPNITVLGEDEDTDFGFTFNACP